MITTPDATKIVSLLSDREIGPPPEDPNLIRFDGDCFEVVGSLPRWGVMTGNGRLLGSYGCSPARYSFRADAERKAAQVKGSVVPLHETDRRRTRWT